MKPATAAQKLGVYLPATPEDFQKTPVTRSQLAQWLESPPEWLVELRRTGPHPRSVVAGKLGVSNAGLARGGVDGALTSAEIASLLAAPPEWLVRERATQAQVRDEKVRIKEKAAEEQARKGGGGI